MVPLQLPPGSSSPHGRRATTTIPAALIMSQPPSQPPSRESQQSLHLSTIQQQTSPRDQQINQLPQFDSGSQQYSTSPSNMSSGRRLNMPGHFFHSASAQQITFPSTDGPDPSSPPQLIHRVTQPTHRDPLSLPKTPQKQPLEKPLLWELRRQSQTYSIHYSQGSNSAHQPLIPAHGQLSGDSVPGTDGVPLPQQIDDQLQLQQQFRDGLTFSHSPQPVGVTSPPIPPSRRLSIALPAPTISYQPGAIPRPQVQSHTHLRSPDTKNGSNENTAIVTTAPPTPVGIPHHTQYTFGAPHHHNYTNHHDDPRHPSSMTASSTNLAPVPIRITIPPPNARNPQPIPTSTTQNTPSYSHSPSSHSVSIPRHHTQITQIDLAPHHQHYSNPSHHSLNHALIQHGQHPNPQIGHQPTLLSSLAHQTTSQLPVHEHNPQFLQQLDSISAQQTQVQYHPQRSYPNQMVEKQHALANQSLTTMQSNTARSAGDLLSQAFQNIKLHFTMQTFALYASRLTFDMTEVSLGTQEIEAFSNLLAPIFGNQTSSLTRQSLSQNPTPDHHDQIPNRLVLDQSTGEPIMRKEAATVLAILGKCINMCSEDYQKCLQRVTRQTKGLPSLDQRDMAIHSFQQMRIEGKLRFYAYHDVKRHLSQAILDQPYLTNKAAGICLIYDAVLMAKTTQSFRKFISDMVFKVFPFVLIKDDNGQFVNIFCVLHSDGTCWAELPSAGWKQYHGGIKNLLQEFARNCIFVPFDDEDEDDLRVTL